MTKTTAQIRQSFLDFFAQRGHVIVPSASLLPQNDPTLMFNNAGMVPFKDVFTGKETRDYVRAASSQKCIRISGKHNDLEAVGPSPRHQTFFEMLGNFSFGDYFKEDAIVFAWEYLTKELGLPQERLMITYFEGDESAPRDVEAAQIWRKLTGFGEDRIVPMGADNFWQMGDTGPCGPSSEIFFCNGPSVDPSKLTDEQDEAGNGWMEIWNLVFMQFERSRVGDAIVTAALPKPSIDTGAGLERLASVVQGKTTNYGVDLLETLVQESARVSGKKYSGTMSPDDVSMRVIADHARTTAFLISEGVLPDRTARPYVLRRVMRRAIRHGHRLGIKEPFLHEVTARVIDMMGDTYPELRERADLIKSVTLGEEVRFRQTIERGLSLLGERFNELNQRGEKVLSGADTFRLYDTFGFPADLTEVICQERGFTTDMMGYEEELSRARLRSNFVSHDKAVQGVYRIVQGAVPGEAVAFSGYETESDRSKVVALIKDGVPVGSVERGDEGVEIVVEKTCFYGESGGQVGDTGLIIGKEGEFGVSDTQKPVSGLVVHRGKMRFGEIRVGDEVELQVDKEKRSSTRRNHSATHLVHWALRDVLGPQAQQKGSLVGPDRLRFDFTHNAALSPEEILKIEGLVNAEVLKNHPIKTEILTMEQARERGATMIFEEKYGDVVRMLTMGPSTELCGGTHARGTGEIGLVKITSEQGIAAGVRRLFATTGAASLAYVQDLELRLRGVAETLKASPDNVQEKISKLLEQRRALEREVDALKKQVMSGGGTNSVDALVHDARDIGGVKVLGVRSEISDRGALRELAEQLRDKLGDSVVLVGALDGPKVALVVTVAKSLTTKWRAGDLIKVAAAKVDGTGGGRPDMAQAGGTNVGGLDAAVSSIYEAVSAVS